MIGRAQGMNPLNIGGMNNVLGEFREARERQMQVRLGRFRGVLGGFREAVCQARTRFLSSAGTILDGLAEARRSRRARRADRAALLNTFEVLGFSTDELRHSRVLAWLLDPDETHGQGMLFFSILLSELGLKPWYATCDYRVHREAKHEESRIDIEVISREFIIHIENKVRQPPDGEQLKREWKDLVREASLRGVDDENRHAFLLTPGGTVVVGAPQFRSLSWGQVARAAETFLKQARAEEVKWFMCQYMRTLREWVLP